MFAEQMRSDFRNILDVRWDSYHRLVVRAFSGRHLIISFRYGPRAAFNKISRITIHKKQVDQMLSFCQLAFMSTAMSVYSGEQGSNAAGFVLIRVITCIV